MLLFHDSKIKFLDHTGDICMQVSSPTLDELFATCAEGMIQTIAPEAKVVYEVQHEIHLTGADLEQLLVDWLSEINYRITVDGEIYNRFEIKRLTETELSALIFGERIDPARHPFELEIKAVTYHDIYIKQSPGGWQARVIFDI